jgi:methoxymalonate biosynthesis acyl carrier protein
MTQTESFATAPQGNVTQASHKYVTKQDYLSLNVTNTLNSGEAEQSATESVEAALLDFLVARLKQPWRADADLFGAGVVTSLFAMELVVYLEEAFGVEVGGDELRLDNFRTVHAMTALVRRLRGGTDE